MRKSIIVGTASVLAIGGALAAYQGLWSGTYADVVSVESVVVSEPVFGELVSSTPVLATVPVQTQVCEDRLVEGRRPERFGDKDGMVIGAIVGGLLGNQVGGGRGRDVATVAGAVGGAYAGREIDRRHVGGQRYSETRRVCRTVEEPQERTIGYDVRYRLDGQLATVRMTEPPVGPQVQVGERDRVIGYDVAWRYEGQTGTVRMDEMPGERLLIRDGVIQGAVAAVEPDRG